MQAALSLRNIYELVCCELFVIWRHCVFGVGAGFSKGSCTDELQLLPGKRFCLCIISCCVQHSGMQLRFMQPPALHDQCQMPVLCAMDCTIMTYIQKAWPCLFGAM
jgi:hypothetical protein